MSQNEDADVVISRADWDRFLSSLQRFMSLHQRTVDRLRELSERKEKLGPQLRDVSDSPPIRAGAPSSASTKQPLFASLRKRIGSLAVRAFRSQTTAMRSSAALPGLSTCGKCGRDLLPNDKFCDACGHRIRP